MKNYIVWEFKHPFRTWRHIAAESTDDARGQIAAHLVMEGDKRSREQIKRTLQAIEQK